MVVFEFGFKICAGNTYVIVMIFCHLILCGNSLTGTTRQDIRWQKIITITYVLPAQILKPNSNKTMLGS
jgi:hypothetical protein